MSTSSGCLTGDGTPLGPPTGFSLSDITAGGADIPSHGNAVAHANPVGHVVTWNRDSVSSDRDVFARAVSPNADVVLGPELTVADGPANQEQVAIACSPQGTCLVVYQSDDNIVGRLVHLLIFRDGFDSGGSSAWDATIQ